MGQIFIQTDGLAMGTSVSPLIANLYLALKFDCELVNKYSNIKVFRYIDDVLIISNGYINFKEFAKISSIYQKPLNTYDYIPSISNHSLSVIEGFILGELITYCRLTTTYDSWLFKKINSDTFSAFSLFGLG